ncbi:hypothetical protein FB639_000194 [Coemansia asiatica]|nr:hypothetical protein FB639_000194 [Coemansia asiatica]
MDTAAGYESDKSQSSAADAMFSDLSDCNDAKESSGTSVVPTAKSVSKAQKRAQKTKCTAASSMVTTGAFMTRTTLRKLGLANNGAYLETVATGVSVGDCVRVLSLDRAWYTAVVLAVQDGRALVHYPRWDHGFDEWIGLESRRLFYTSKMHDSGLTGSDIAEYQKQIAVLDKERSTILDGFDLQAQIVEAVGVMAEPDPEAEAEAEAEVSDTEVTHNGIQCDPDSVDEPAAHKKGRPLGMRNRRRVGRVKHRDSKARNRAKKEPKPKPKPMSEPETEPEIVPQTVVPKELRIARIRQIQKIDNPYAVPRKSYRSIADSDSDVENSPKGLTAADASSSTLENNAVWDLLSSSSSYVTTGAFTTRRTIRCLAHEESTGGIIQDHHGFFPGQLVEVMNANRRWYHGRLISYENKRFLIHYMGWGHEQNEWVAQDSKRMRALDVQESEEQARKICAQLVDENNAYVDDIEQKRIEQERQLAEKRKPKADAQADVKEGNQLDASQSLASKQNDEIMAAAAATNNAKSQALVEKDEDGEEELEEDLDSDVEPISVETGYTAVPQLLRVKDYVRFYRRGMRVAARDRDKLWWKAVITDIKTFRLRIHYEGFSKSWDEWMEMNTQRIMIEDTADSSSNNASDQDNLPLQSQPQPQPQPQPVKRLGRPPKLENKLPPMTLQLALRMLVRGQGLSAQQQQQHQNQHQQQQQSHSGSAADPDAFELPREHMSIKEFGVFLQIGDKVQIRDRDKQWYGCTIIDFKHGRIRVCFDGHPDEYNQWIAVNSDRIRVLKSVIEGDGRLERLERDTLTTARKRREKAREKRRKQMRVARSSLIQLAESLEYVLADSDSEDSRDNMPLILRILEGGSETADAMPLAERLRLSRQLQEQAAAKQKQQIASADSKTWFVYCNQCNVVIRTFRYYCTECEHPSDGFDYESFDLCLGCFVKRFPASHAHPRTAFARAPVSDADSIVEFTERMLGQCKGDAQLGHLASLVSGILAIYEPDAFDDTFVPSQRPDVSGTSTELWNTLANGLHGTTTQASDVARAIYAPGIKSRIGGCAAGMPRCAFCGSADPAQTAALGGFAGGLPFVLPSNVGGQIRRQRFWAHDACARGSPEVLVSASGQWYNVAAALRRGRTIVCAGCRRRGATVGCFHDRCQKSFHVGCAGQSPAGLGTGQLFWCSKHAAAETDVGADSEGALPQCAACDRQLTSDLMWMVCLECPPQPLPFSICLACYESRDALASHPHKKRCFREHLAHAGISGTNGAAASKRGPRGRKRGRDANAKSCHYCCTRTARRWRRGYGGTVMCEDCFSAAHELHGLQQQRNGQASQDLMDAQDADADADEVEVVALNPFGSLTAPLAEEYSQRIYFTRDICAATSTTQAAPSHQPLGHLQSYGPTDSMLFTLIVDCSYFDIPGRAPRWASHSGTDYHGTWLPQTVRRALLRYTRRGERVLSNFLGRGTDAIECFLLSRKCIGVDINPSAVALSQRNCSFSIAAATDMDVSFRPVIVQGDARSLGDGAWPGAEYFAEAESFDHVLSHPPYKDCVLYSTNIDGDLSRFPGPEEFQREMEKVIAQSWRLLKMGRHLTLGIGDNRAECFYIPVSFHLIRSYIDCGFELDELLVKRQRYCQAFGLGTYLCVQFDFLMFTHEFIASLRKVSKESVDRMVLPASQYTENPMLGFHLSCADTFGADQYLESESNVQSPLMAISVAQRILRQVPPSPINRKSVVMGSVWTFERHAVHSFSQLCMSRMVERFGRDLCNWEQIDLELKNLSQTSDDGTGQKEQEEIEYMQMDRPEDLDESSMSDSQDESSEIEHLDNGTHAGEYERERQRQIRENREQLLHLGLVSALGEDSNDIAHYRKLLSMPSANHVPDLPLALVVVPHIPNSMFSLVHIASYRRALVQIAHDASHRLSPSGMLVLGVQDIRDEHGKLWPLGMLVLEDVQRAVGHIRLRLKEFIVVVENGHARKRDDVLSRDGFVEEKCIVERTDPDIHLPIVHAYYLVFMKLK